MSWSRCDVAVVALTSIYALAFVYELGAAGGDEEPDQAPAQAPTTRVAGVVTHQDGSAATNIPVSVHGHDAKPLAHATSDADGRFAMEVAMNPQAVAFGAHFRAETEQSISMVPVGVYNGSKYELADAPRPVILEPKREVRVTVVDTDGEPVEDSGVALRLDGHWLHLRENTDRVGQAKFRVPMSRQVERVLAWKDGAGLDYRSFIPPIRGTHSGQTEVPKFNDEGETLMLGGARSLSVRVVDASGQPVQGDLVHPWLLNPPDQIDSINTSFFTELRATTNDAGVAKFDWIPTWQTKQITFWNSGLGRHTHQRVEVSPGSEPDELGVHATIRVHKLVRLSGRVVDADGQPAVDVEVSIAGQGNERHFADVTTDTEGKYDNLVPPNMIYMITATKRDGDDRIAVADTLTGFAVIPGEPHHAQDLVLRRPSVVTGTLTESNGTPAADQRITFYHYGADLKDLPPAIRSKLPRLRRGAPIRFEYVKTDAQGRFELGLGDGRYDVRPPGRRGAEAFEITDGTAPHFDLKLSPQDKPSIVFSGNVVFPDGRPASGALIEAVRQGISRGWKTKADENGQFSVKEHRGDKTLHLSSADGTHSATVAVGEHSLQRRFVIQPLGSAKFTLINDNGQAIAGRKVLLRVTLHQIHRSGFMMRNVGEKTTDQQGQVSFEKLVPGSIHRLTLADGPREARRRALKSFAVEPGEAFEDYVVVP